MVTFTSSKLNTSLKGLGWIKAKGTQVSDSTFIPEYLRIKTCEASGTLDYLNTYLLHQAVFGWIVHICLNWKLKQIDFDLMQGKTFSRWGQSSIGTGCLEDCVIPDCADSWGFSKPDWKKPRATWSEVVIDLAFSRRLDYDPLDVILSSLNKPVIHMFCTCS